MRSWGETGDAVMVGRPRSRSSMAWALRSAAIRAGSGFARRCAAGSTIRRPPPAAHRQGEGKQDRYDVLAAIKDHLASAEPADEQHFII